MNRKSVAKAILEAVDKKKDDDNDDEKKDAEKAAPPGPPANGEVDKVTAPEGPGDDEVDTGKGFAPDANMTIKDNGEDDDDEGTDDDAAEAGDESTKKELFAYIVTNKTPSDAQVHAMASQLGMEPDDLEEVIYSIIGSFSAGKSVGSGLRTENVDPEELRMGVEVEAEHSDLPFIAERIAMDHLAEIPDYYSRLKKMEDEAKAEGSTADTNPQPDDGGKFPRAPTSWPKGKREPSHSMDVHDGEGEDDGW